MGAEAAAHRQGAGDVARGAALRRAEQVTDLPHREPEPPGPADDGQPPPGVTGVLAEPRGRAPGRPVSRAPPARDVPRWGPPRAGGPWGTPAGPVAPEGGPPPLPAGTVRDAPAAPAGSAGEPSERATAQLGQLRFLHHVVRLATTAQTWDELLDTVVDQTRDALHADVSSLYLLDRDELRLTLAATNGLDKYQIGRATVPFGEGVTGWVAATRQPLVIADVAHDPRFLWVRGIDQKRFVPPPLSAPLALPEKKRRVGGSVAWRRRGALARKNAIVGPFSTSADAMEGAAVFAEKRPPVWRGE